MSVPPVRQRWVLREGELVPMPERPNEIVMFPALPLSSLESEMVCSIQSLLNSAVRDFAERIDREFVGAAVGNPVITGIEFCGESLAASTPQPLYAEPAIPLPASADRKAPDFAKPKAPLPDWMKRVDEIVAEHKSKEDTR